MGPAWDPRLMGADTGPNRNGSGSRIQGLGVLTQDPRLMGPTQDPTELGPNVRLKRIIIKIIICIPQVIIFFILIL